MPIEIECVCGSAYRLADDRAGENFTCRVCGNPMQLPGPAPTSQAAGADEVAAAAAAEGAATTTTATVTGTGTNAPPAPAADALRPEDIPTGMSPLPKPTGSQQGPTGPVAAGSPVSTHAIGPMETPWFDPQMTLRHPPKAWWITRTVMWGLCVGFLFVPWFGVSASGSAAGDGGAGPQSKSITGFEIVKATVEGLARSGGTPQSPLSGSGMNFDELPDGAGAIVAGAFMMAGGPNLYAVGLALALVFAFVAYKRDGKGAGWPFFIAWAGILSFVLGWHVLTSVEELSRMMEMVERMGVSVGPSPWAYLMVLLLVPMALIARSRPDHDLEDAIAMAEY